MCLYHLFRGRLPRVRVLKFDPRRVNLLEVGSKKLFLLAPSEQETFLVSAVCPHRGGPLHLGRLDTSEGVIQCPWHDRGISLRHLLREALPLVLRRDSAVAILDESEEAQVLLRRRVLPAGPPNSCGAVVRTSRPSCAESDPRGTDGRGEHPRKVGSP
ncbi:Rieske 2Fe-2S domain-containing protein [Cystobacter fuscus]|uniref:Rieske 2Fe-2S domain-containing protein n=1 Tax=Cystobacter fuscus TaxID=43 RepID=UPI000BB384B8